MATIADLIEVSPPPTGIRECPWPAGDTDADADADADNLLPKDYRGIVNTYGRGIFGDSLWLMMPSDKQPRMSIRTQIGVTRQAFQMLADSVPDHRPPYDVNTLFPCAATINGDTVYWVTDRSADPDRWPITVQPTRDPSWHDFEGPLLDFLVAVFTGDHVCPAFPPDFPATVGTAFATLS